MKKIHLALLAASAIAAISIGSASAMPLNNVPAALGESQVQDVRLVCDQYGRCYNTRRNHRGAQFYRAPRYNNHPAYYGGHGYNHAPAYGYYGGPRVGIGIGPRGVQIW